MTDKQKGWLLMGIAVLGYIAACLLIRRRFSFMYGIPAVPLIWGRILLNTTPEERQARPFFKVLGIILIVLFVGMSIIGTLMEIAYLNR